MKAEKGHILYRIDRLAAKILRIVAGIALILVILSCFDISNRYIWYVVGSIFFLSVICRIVLDYFVKSEAEEEFEQQVEYILEKQQAKEEAERKQVIENYSPLCGLTHADEGLVKQLLQELPANANKPEAINLALVSQYLTALQKLGYADLKDKYHLRLWVEKVTKKKAPNSSQFNEAIPSTANAKVSTAQKELVKLLHLD